MNEKSRNILIGVLIVIVVVLSGLLGAALGGAFNPTKVIAEGIVIGKDSNKTYESVLLTSYEEYTNLLSKYEVSDQVFLTNGAFDDNDYIVDFINYKDSLEIDDINLTITPEGIDLIYYVNKTIDSSNKYLMYFIPINKGLISEVTITSREFKVV